jgi:purine-binding chemotaxis protein CheW
MDARRRVPRGQVNWAEVRERVDAAGRALAGGTAESPERVREVLEERARVLAQAAVAPPAGEELEVITFTLANETYAVESMFVVAVFRLADLSLLPGAKPPVCGVTAWRGDLLTILDLRPLLGLSSTALNDLSRVIVLGEERPAFGVLADAVLDLVVLPASEVREPSEGTAAGREYLRGITGGAVQVLDARTLLRIGVRS